MLPQSAYHDILDQSSDWKDYLIITLYDHLTETMETLEAVAFDRTDRRLAALAARTQRRWQNADQHDPTRRLPSSLALSARWFPACSAKFKGHGAVALGRGRIDILAPAFLKKMLDN